MINYNITTGELMKINLKLAKESKAKNKNEMVDYFNKHLKKEKKREVNENE